MLLDALLAAGDRLIVTYSGNDERTNAPRPPAVPVGELLDAIDATARAAGGRADLPARDQVVDPPPAAAVRPAELRGRGARAAAHAWSFDRSALEGARALERATRAGAAVPARAAPGPPASMIARVELDQPDRVRRAAGARLPAPAARDLDARHRRRGRGRACRSSSTGSTCWQIGQRLLDGLLAGRRLARLCCDAEIARGALPPGLLGVPVDRLARAPLSALAEHARSAVTRARGPLDRTSTCRFPGDRRLDRVGLGVRGDVLLSVQSYSPALPAPPAAAWVRLLALTAGSPRGRSRR